MGCGVWGVGRKEKLRLVVGTIEIRKIFFYFFVNEEVTRPNLSIINSQLSIINYQFSILNYQLSILNYQFSILHSPFSIDNSKSPGESTGDELIIWRNHTRCHNLHKVWHFYIRVSRYIKTSGSLRIMLGYLMRFKGFGRYLRKRF